MELKDFSEKEQQEIRKGLSTAEITDREAADKTNLKVKCALALSQYPDHEELQDRLIDMGLRL